MEKSMAGDLAHVEVPDLLTFLNMGRRTGALLLDRPGQQTSLFFRDGAPIYAKSNKEGLRLSDILVRVGKLTPEQERRILETHRSSDRPVAQVLLAEGIFTSDDLASFLKIQTSEVVFDTFRWQGGSFAFYDDVPPPTHAAVLEMDLQNLIMEGVRRLDEEGRLAQVFPDMRSVVDLVSSPERVKHSMTLRPEEWQVYFLVDGRRSLSEICQLSGQPSETTTLDVLRRLVEANLVVVSPPRAPTAGAPAADREDIPDTEELKAFHIEFAGATPVPRSRDDSPRIVHPEAIRYSGHDLKPLVAHLLLPHGAEEIPIPLTRDSCCLGRHSNNDIVVDDSRVSAFHARIDRTRNGYLLVDLRSTNGTFLNTRRVDAGILKSGDEIRLGPARLRFKLDETSLMAHPRKSADRPAPERHKAPGH